VDRRAGGFALVALAAAVWALDGLFRLPAAAGVAAPVVVLAEHVVLVLCTLPLLPGALRAARGFSARQWAALVLVGAGASALATVLFTASFTYGDPTTPLLLQQVEPVIALAAAHVVLGERLRRRFVPAALTAAVGAWLVAFPQPTQVGISAAAPALYALGATVLWGLGTVFGRQLTGAATWTQVTALRFLIGLPAAGALTLMTGAQVGPAFAPGNAWRLLLLALVPGLLGMLLYYRGLERTPASAATFAELAFPLTAVLVNRLAFGATLTGTQALGALVLSAAVLWLGVRDRRAADRPAPEEETGVVAPPEPLAAGSR
jgi:drug/metabolite transporter, DME family